MAPTRLVVLFVFALILLLGPQEGASGHKIAFLYATSISDFGYSYSHELARIAVEKSLTSQGFDIFTTFAASLDTSTKATVAIENFVSQGYDLIVGTGAQFYVPIVNASAFFPSQKFVAINGVKPTANVAIGFPRLWEVSYLLGATCGLMSKTKVVGYVSAFPDLPSHTRSINAFFIGARSVEPQIRVELGVVNSFLDPLVENRTTSELVLRRVDCLASQVNDDTPNKRAAELEILSGGYASDNRFFSGESVTSSVMFQWLPYYNHFLRQIVTNTWLPNQAVNWGLPEKSVELAYWSTKVPTEVREFVSDKIESISNGTTQIFCGEYADEFRPGSNGCLNDPEILPMSQLLSGINFSVNLTRSDVIELVFVHWNESVAIIVAVLAAILLVCAILSTVDLLAYRNTIAYRASSPLFCGLILVGVVLIYISVFFWIGQPTDASCMLRAWFGGIGFTLIFSCIVCKTWRIYRIFGDRSLRLFAIRNTELLAQWILPIMCLELIILVLWQSLDPLVATQIQSVSSNDPNVCVVCQSRSSTFLIIFLVFKVCLLIPAAVLSYGTRNITEDFKESETIGIAVFLSFVIGLLVLGVDIILGPMQVLAFFDVSTFGILALSGVIYTVIFVPKAHRIHVVGDKDSFSATSSSRDGSLLAVASTPTRFGRL